MHLLMSIEQILPTVPSWILSIIALMWAVDKFLLPIFVKYKDSDQKDVSLKAVKAELDSIKKEVQDCEARHEALDTAYHILRGKYDKIIGMLRGFQVYLRDKGMADFPMMDDLVKHTGEDTSK